MMRDQLSRAIGEEARFGISRMRQPAEGARRFVNKGISTSRHFADGCSLRSRQTYGIPAILMKAAQAPPNQPGKAFFSLKGGQIQFFFSLTLLNTPLTKFFHAWERRHPCLPRSAAGAIQRRQDARAPRCRQDARAPGSNITLLTLY
jgi:hypothetical protein